MSRARQAGFTIIELVVVILLLGILAATALPRFIDVTDDAYDAAYQGILGGFSTGSAMFHAQWVADGQPASGALSIAAMGQTNATGYPIGDDGTLDAIADCTALWGNVLQGGRPTVFAAGTPGAADAQDILDAVAAGDDMVADWDSSTTCTYYYATRGGAASAPGFAYDTATGEITTATAL